MELIKFLGVLAAALPLVYGAPTPAAENLHPKILEAMKRDLGLDAEAATQRVARDIAATEVIENVRRSAGAAFGGAWLSEEGRSVHIGITDEALAHEVRAAGAIPVVVRSSLSKLEEAKQALDSIDISETSIMSVGAEDSGIASYFVDVAANKLVIEVLPNSVAHAEGLAAQVGLAQGEYDVQVVNERPSTYVTIRGGDAYYIGGGRCSVGFSVTTGFVTAGHCGRTGTAATTSSGASLGSFAGSVFPGSADMAYVRTTSSHTLSGTINRYSQSALPVSGSTVTAVGGSICRSGSTTQVHCGTVRAFSATVNYAEGRVTGLTQTNVCAEPGDSGGSFYTGGQAQGVTSGGSGNCNSGGTTYFQPVGEILSTYGLTLVRG